MVSPTRMQYAQKVGNNLRSSVVGIDPLVLFVEAETIIRIRIPIALRITHI